MQHLIMVHSNPETWEHPTFEHTSEFLASAPAERAEMSDQFSALMGEISGSGELVGGGAFAAPGQGRTVRVRDGVSSVTQGPYLGSTGGAAGYFVVECDIERATDIAARFPDARFAAVEVRPIVG